MPDPNSPPPPPSKPPAPQSGSNPPPPPLSTPKPPLTPKPPSPPSSNPPPLSKPSSPPSKPPSSPPPPPSSPPPLSGSKPPPPISAPKPLSPPPVSTPPPSLTEAKPPAPAFPPSPPSPAPSASKPLPSEKPITPPPSSLPSPPSPPSPPPPPPPPSLPADKSGQPQDVVKKSPFKWVGPVLIVLAILGLGFFVFSKLLGPKKSSEPKTVTLSYWGLWEPSQNLLDTFAKFEAANPGVKINYVQQSHKDYRERLQAAIERGQGPDIFRFHNTWVPLLKNELSPIPKDIYSPSEFETTFYPTASKDLKVGTNYIGIPLMFDGLALYYNTKIFATANKKPPSTWEELRKTAAELTVKNEEDRIIRSGAALGTTSNVDHWPDILALMMFQNGANPANPTDKFASDAIAFYTIFKRSDRIWDDTMPNSTYAFATEKVAMMLAPSWRTFDIVDINPDLEFATVPTPQLPGTSIHWASYWAEGVSSSADKDKQALAWQLLKYLSQPEALATFYNSASKVRLFGEPYSRVDMADQLKSDPVVGAFITSAPDAQSWYLSGWTHDNGLNDRIIKYYEDAVNTINQGKNITQALETTAEGVVQILSQFGVSGALR